MRKYKVSKNVVGQGLGARGLVAAAAVLALGASCMNAGASGAPAAAATEVVRSALNAAPQTSDFVFEAGNSIVLHSSPLSVNGGDLGARGTGSGPFLSGSVAIDLSSGAKVQSTHSIIADSIRLNTGVVVGDLQTNHLVNPTSGTHGSVTAVVPLPGLPALAVVTPGTQNLTVAGGKTVTSSPGQFLTVSLGTSSILRLNAGTYQMKDLTIGTGGRLEALGTVKILIANRLSAGSNFFIGPASSCTQLTAKDIRIEVSGINGTDGKIGSTPVAASLGSNGSIRALVLAPNGTLAFASSTCAKGAFMARDIDVGSSNAAYTFEDGFPNASCTAQSCDDKNPCTSDTCTSNGTCTHTNVAAGTSCSDGNACNGLETCNASGVCQAGTPVVCGAGQCQVAGTCNTSTGQCSAPTNKTDGTTCNDGNACTQTDACTAGTCVGSNPVVCSASQCQVAGTCNTSTGQCSAPTNKTDGTTCNDGNLCTQTDACTAGSCVGTNPVVCSASQCQVAGTCNTTTGVCSSATNKTDGTTCSDGNACTQTDTCTAGTCVGTNPVTCAAAGQCQVAGTCNTTTGVCSATTNKTDGTTCSDGNACTQTDTCTAGTCVGTNPVTCAAAGQCQVAGTCNTSTGVCSAPTNKTDGTTCSDGNACTQTDTCTAGTCVGANPVTCAAAGQCQVAGTCNTSTGVCSAPTNKTDGTTCSDGNACTQTDTCTAGTCVGTNPVTCAAAGQCQVVGTCNTSTGVCSAPTNKTDGTTCSDGNACTQTDTCTAGTCVGANPVTCAAAGQCQVAGTCNTSTGVCSAPTNKTDGTTCSDGNACTQTDTCTAGTCVGANPVTCAAAGQCQVAGTCNTSTGVCSAPTNKTDGTACNDGNLCTQTDACSVGACVGSNPVVCSAGQCQVAGTCNTSTGQCSVATNKTDGTTCNDGNLCTQTDACTAGACVGSNPVMCSAGQCQVAGTCNTNTGQCSAATNKTNGTTCNDGNPCTQTDACSAGTCVGSNPVVCSAGQCQVAGTCNTSTGVCSAPTNATDGTTCNDGNQCTQTDACAAGSCVGTNPVVCSAGQCQVVGTCNTGTGQCSAPTNRTDGTTCNDGNLCTQTDACTAGACVGTNPVVCSAGQCQVAGTCNTSTGVCSAPTNATNGTTCNDGNSCTFGDSCQSGVCSGASTCDDIKVTQNVFQTISSPSMTFTQFSGSASSATPGDPIVYTGVINNVGGSLQIGTDVTLQNLGTSAYTIASFSMIVQVFSTAQQAWVSFGGVSYDANYNSVLDPSLVQMTFSEYLPFGPTNTTVGPHPVVGAVVGVGGSITWSTTLSVNMTALQVQALLNPTGANQIRLVTSFSTPAFSTPTTGVTSDFSSRMAGVTGAATNVRINMSYQTITPGNFVIGPYTGHLNPGQSTTLTGTIVSPLIAAKASSETDQNYLDRLRNDVFYGYFIGTAGNADAVGGNNPPQFYPPNSWGLSLNIPILTVTKTGPATAGVGQALDYFITAANEGKVAASNLSITDTVDATTVAGPIAAPYSADALTGRVDTTISYQIPATRGAGPMTDVAAVTWHDQNGNLYGPMTGSFTTSVIAGGANDPGPHITSSPVTRLPRTTVNTAGVPFDLRSWSKVQFPLNDEGPATWTTDPTGTVATNNGGDASILLGNIPISNGHVQGTMAVNATDDNDPIGFAFGYQDTGHFYLFDWKEGTENDPKGGLGLQGMSVKVVSKSTPLTLLDLWQTSSSGPVRTLFHNNIPWQPFQPYSFSLDYQPGHFVITIKQGATTLATIALDDSTYAGGAFGYYAESQDGVTFTGFSHDSLINENYHYQVVASDTDGDPINYKLLSAPAGMTIDPVTGLVSWATQPGAGAYLVTVEAIDAAGLTDTQTYTVTVEDNHPPVLDAGPDQQLLGVTFPATAQLAGSVSDELTAGDPQLVTTWSKVSGPGTVTFANGASPTTTAMFSDIGTYVLQLQATDGVSTSTDFVTIFLDSQPSLAGATLNLVASSPGPIADGTALRLMATLLDSASHPIPSVAVKFDVAGANAQSAYVATNSSGVATYIYTGGNQGTDVTTATALGAGGTPTSTLPGILWTAPNAPPSLLTQGWIGAPLHQATVTGQVPVTVASGVALASGTLTYWPMSAPDQVHTLATGVSGGPGTTIATLDTTVLANGSWIVKLDATNNMGQQLVSEVEVTVTGDYKPGRLVVEVADMTIPVTGIPVTVGRRYDSLEKENVGDFGHGWSLTLGHPKLEVDPAHNVTITMPDNRRVTFYFEATSLTNSILFSWLFGPSYVPEAGTHGSLTADGCSALVQSGGQLVCFLDGSLDYAPTTYKYTDPYGRVFVMGADGSLKSIADRQQNVLTFAPNGIFSNTGVGVTFVRDAQGRITKVTGPAVDSTTGPIVNDYEYDANGDLSKVDLPGAANDQYTYAAHRLLTTKDPNGNPTRTSTYDTAGRLAADTDALSNVTRYAYDVPGHTTTITNPDLGTVVQTFDDRGLLLEEVDPLGRTTQHTYDANRNELTRTNALGEVTTMTYDSNGNQTSIKNDRNETTHVLYNAFSEPVSSADPTGHTSAIGYDDHGIATNFSDEMGVLATFTSSEHGLPLTVTDASGKTANLTYDEFGNLTSRTDRLGRITANAYDGMGRLTQVTDPRGTGTAYSYLLRGPKAGKTDLAGVVGQRSFAYQYDQNLNLTSETSDLGRSTSYTYDALNHLTKVTHADGTTTQYTRDFRGNPLTMKDEAQRTTTYEYDKAGQLKKTTFPDGAFTTRNYDDLGRLVTATDEQGNPTTYEYEAGCGCAERVTKVTDPLERSTVTTYDPAGRRASVTDAAGHTTSYDYDVRGHLVTTTYADHTTETDAYDALGRRTAHTDQMSSVTQYGYDAEGQLTSVTDALTHVTRYGYDASGNLTSVTDANNHATGYVYDHLNRKSQRTLPLGMRETWTYNMYGDNLTHVDFRGKTTSMTYDDLARPLTKVPDPTLGEATVRFTYNLTGTRATMADASGSTTYGYDTRDRLLTKATAAGTLTYTFDPAGNVASIRSSNVNGTSVDYDWDAANQLVSVTDNRAGGMTTAAYTATGRPGMLTQPSGVGAVYSYDTRDRVTSLSWQRGSNPAFGSWSYGFNGRGQRTSVTDAVGRHVAYGYDAVSRLVSETVTSDPRGAVGNGELDYSLDPTGNRLTRTSTLAALGAQTFTYDANDELTIDGYDANGNTTGSDGHAYSYDFENRLRSKDGGAVTIVYDGDGNRVAKTVGGVTTKYLLDDLNPTGYLQVLEEVVGGAPQVAYTYGTMLVSEMRSPGPSSQTSYYGYDAHGNITFLTDSSGNVTDSYDYDAWGTLVAQSATTANTRLYAGEEFDPDLGVINLRARYYQAERGRFVTSDPLQKPNMAADPTIVLDQSESWEGVIFDVLVQKHVYGSDASLTVALNRYLYSNSDSVNMSDRRGTDVALSYINFAVVGKIVVLGTVGIVAVGILANAKKPPKEVIGVPEAPPPPPPPPPGSGCKAAFELCKAICTASSPNGWARTLCITSLCVPVYLVCLAKGGGG